MIEFKNIHTVAVIGAGTMGQGIAQVCAQAGYTTLLFDANEDILPNAILSITKNLNSSVSKGKISSVEQEETVKRIIVTKHLGDVKADLIIEAVVEQLEIKQKLFQEVENINEGKAILATNTSSISITQIASVLMNPANCIGLHFFNPARLMKLVEIVSGDLTDTKLCRVLAEFQKNLERFQ